MVGNSHKGLLPEVVHGLLIQRTSQDISPPSNQSLIPAANLLNSGGNVPIWADDGFAHSYIEDAQVMPGSGSHTQTRPNLKIQEGCGNRCTFCVIPTTRGASRSLPAAKVLAQVKGSAAGGKELVLSGINLWAMGPRSPGKPVAARFAQGDPDRNRSRLRLRLRPIEPMDWAPEMIGVMRDFAGTRVARHAHLPLQSGSDSVLRRMHRRYRPWHYEQKVAALLDAAGTWSLRSSADVMIVVFPAKPMC